jgi:hypothetical protein
LFIAGLAFLQYQQIASSTGIKLKALTGLIVAITNNLNESSITPVMMSNFGIPLTGSMASGFTVGFLKG